jgi:NAD-specific glutamate dehydrogenase
MVTDEVKLQQQREASNASAKEQFETHHLLQLLQNIHAEVNVEEGNNSTDIQKALHVGTRTASLLAKTARDSFDVQTKVAEINGRIEALGKQIHELALAQDDTNRRAREATDNLNWWMLRLTWAGVAFAFLSLGHQLLH